MVSYFHHNRIIKSQIILIIILIIIIIIIMVNLLNLTSTIHLLDDEPILNDSDTVKNAVDHLQKLLPAVTSHLAENGRLDDWLSFFKLVESGEFNVSHIAAQLFLDVIQFAVVKDVRAMRYTPAVKQFWSIGQSLFRAKFLRYMGGYKTFSELSESTNDNEKSMIKADVSLINFACPNKNILIEEKKKFNIECDEPGIILSNLDAVSSITQNKDKAFNLCVDGKKITSGFGKNLGEVNIFGHESTPTYQQKKDRLEIELCVVDNTMKEISRWIEREVTVISELNMDSKNLLHSNVLDIISMNSERIKELRQLKVKLQMSLEKLMKMVEEPWQKSKYSYAISSTKTKLHEIHRCINDALELNDKLGLVAAACNGAEKKYIIGNMVELTYQENYSCISSSQQNQTSNEERNPTRFVKQRSEKWLHDRKQAKATGSTIFKALGLSTLKDQQAHYDRVKDGGLKENGSESANEAMKYGVENEINATGTLASKILPILAPSSVLHEEGYYTITCADNPNFLVVSPDGSCRENDKVKYAVEIKCPVPGKKFTTDVHYAIPKYYITQILAEMAALECEELLYVSWTPESTTILKAIFDEDLWEKIKTELQEVYGGNCTRPSKKRPAVASLLSDINKYTTEKVTLICEMPSVVSMKCCHSTFDPGSQCYMMKHEACESNEKLEKEAMLKRLQLSIQSLMTIISKEKVTLVDMYNIARVPAKEVLVAVLSDLDRTHGPGNIHGVPVAYGLSGYSFKVKSMRSMMEEVITKCYERNIPVKSLSTDGQFSHLAVRDKEEKPLTVLQLAKDTWEKVKKLTKTEQVHQLMKLNYENHDDPKSLISALDYTRDCGAIVLRKWVNKEWPKLYNPSKLRELIKKTEKKKTENKQLSTCELDTLPADAATALLDEVEENLHLNTNERVERSVNAVDECTTKQHEPLNHEVNDCVTGISVEHENSSLEVEDEMDINESQNSKIPDFHIDHMSIQPEILQNITEDLSTFDKQRKKAKWKDLRPENVGTLLSSEPEELIKLFTKHELYSSGLHFKANIERALNKHIDNMTKVELANAFSLVFGTGTQFAPKKSPLKLRAILKDYFLNKMPKDAVNAITATRVFLEEDLPAWRRNCPFQDGIRIGSSHEPYVWYSQPEYFDSVGELIVYLLDCHHLLVNARSFVCQNGISGLNVDKKAWAAVAEASDSSETGLNRAMVIDLIDKQSNAIAQIVFGEKVEKKMIELGWPTEAKFCKTIREWYKAEDEAGLSQETRLKYRMNMRDLLLTSVNLADFPPPGTYVAGMTSVMFEGILTNIDRRFQLHALIPGNTYNVRAPNTLVVENLFSSFQELDPKSTGVLLPDDIPHAIETASFLIQTRLDPDRYCFYLFNFDSCLRPFQDYFCSNK